MSLHWQININNPKTCHNQNLRNPRVFIGWRGTKNRGKRFHCHYLLIFPPSRRGLIYELGVLVSLLSAKCSSSCSCIRTCDSLLISKLQSQLHNPWLVLLLRFSEVGSFDRWWWWGGGGGMINIGETSKLVALYIVFSDQLFPRF